jgi:hypothetical protein
LHCKRQNEAKAKVEAPSGSHDEMANFATIRISQFCYEAGWILQPTIQHLAATGQPRYKQIEAVFKELWNKPKMFIPHIWHVCMGITVPYRPRK